MMAWSYGACGSWADAVLVNSTWTRDHIHELWRVPRRTRVVFPPCSAKQFSEAPLEGREPWIVSIAQYRCVWNLFFF
jgi:alpha-1,2-mannosyltransferase